MPYDWRPLEVALQDARHGLNLTQDELAELSDVSLKTIQNFEGARRPTRWPKKMAAVEKALGKPEGWARAIAEGRTPPGSDTSDNVVQLPTRPDELPPDDDFVRQLRALRINEELRRELIKSYWRDKAREDAARREKYLNIAKAAES